ncbi:MAG: hypothetical protein RIB59_05095 [Rhodospirillales bacterium]
METKQSFRQKIEAQKAEIQADVHALRARVKKLEAEGRRDLSGALETIERKRAEAETKLDGIKNDSADAWENAKGNVEAAYSDLRKAVSNAVERFR